MSLIRMNFFSETLNMMTAASVIQSMAAMRKTAREEEKKRRGSDEPE